MRRRLGRYRRSLTRRLRAFLHPPGVKVGGARPVARPELSEADQATVDAFHQIYWRETNGTHWTLNVNWLGYRATKCPFDLWTYQEIITETKPELIVESGTRHGGTSLFLANMLDLIGSANGRVITIDVVRDPALPVHPRIEYLNGSSLDAPIASRIKAAAKGKRTMLILDSLHDEDHVANELRLYNEIVTPGCYLIVEDTNVNGHPVNPEHGPGPGEAVAAFLQTTKAFEVDRNRERFLMTLNPGGYLRRVS
jgi:cephalosporin hydroxylase